MYIQKICWKSNQIWKEKWGKFSITNVVINITIPTKTKKILLRDIDQKTSISKKVLEGTYAMTVLLVET